MSERAILPQSEWLPVQDYTDAARVPIKGDQPRCTIGVYLLSKEDGDLYGPACSTCEFSATLGNVFNPDEQRYAEGAPECFKTAAARILSEIMPAELSVIRKGRPETAAIIDSYAERAGRS
jgi:hypothetical protein